MEKTTTIARILLGLAFTVFGLDYFFHFMPQGDSMPSAEGMAFLEALIATGYMFPMIKTIEIVSGLLLISGFLAPLALMLLAPVVVNITLYHLVLDANGLWLALALAALEAFLLWSHRDCFREVLALRPRSSADLTAVPSTAVPSG
jgi:uncharacterized membrane protein YphA (DoxX/SURF4 family)